MKYSLIHDTIRGGVVCGVLACRSEDQLYCASRGKCVVAAFYYCNGIDDCGDGADKPDNCSQPAFCHKYILERSKFVLQKLKNGFTAGDER